MPKPNSIFKASTDKSLLTPIKLKKPMPIDYFRTVKKSFTRTVRNDPVFYDALELDIQENEIILGDPISSFSEFDLFLATIAEYLEDGVIIVQDLHTTDLLGIVIEDGKAYNADISVNVILGEEIVMKAGE